MAKTFKFRLSELVKSIIHVGNDIKTINSVDSANKSPLTIAAGVIKILKVPDNAAEIVFNSEDDVLFSEDPLFSSYDRALAGIPQREGIVRRDTFPIKNGTGSSIVVYYHWVTL